MHIKEDEEVKDTLADELSALENEEDDTPPADDDTPPEDDVVEDDDEPEVNIVDLFTSGDMDAVKAHIHDKVVLSVSDAINNPESLEDDDEPPADED